MMDSQSSNQTNKQHQKVEFVAQQVLKAMNQQTQNESDVIIFLNKLYKNNSSSKNKRMKSIRLNKFVNLLDYIVCDFPQKRLDAQILYNSILSTLLNDKNFYDEQDDQLVEAMGIQFARIIQKLSERQFGCWTVKILSYLIKGQTINLSLQINQFEEKIKQSTYYQSINLDNKSQSIRFSNQYSNNYLLEQVNIGKVILRNVNFQKVYSRLFKSSENKLEVANLFYQHLKMLEKPPKSRKQLFYQCFLSSQKLEVSQAQAILKLLEKQLFDRQSINQIVKRITGQKLPIQELLLIDFKKIKGIEQVFIQCLIQLISKRNIQDIISIFLNMKDSHNFFPLYLILKSNKKIPVEYVNLLFEDDQVFTVRRSIIFVLAIIQNQVTSFDTLLNSFSTWDKAQKVRTKRVYQCALKAIHFSLQSISKANVISIILNYIHKIDLNSESNLQYLSYSSLKVSTQQQIKIVLTQSHRQNLSRLFKILSQFQGMLKSPQPQLTGSQQKEVELQHKFKLDLQFIVSSNPFIEQQIFNSVKELNKMLGDSTTVEQLLRQLPTMKQNSLEVVLMWVNNKYDTYYSQEVNNNVIEWAVKAFKKYTAELSSQLKAALEKQKLDRYFKLVKALLEYGMERQTQLKMEPENQGIFTQAVRQVVNSSNSKSQRMSGNNFNDYFLNQSKWKRYMVCQGSQKAQKSYRRVIWIKAILMQVKQLIKNMVKAQKAGNRKQIKNIIVENVEDVLALKCIHEYFDSELQQGRTILTQIFRNVQPEIQAFERTQKLAHSLGMDFHSIYDELPSLLELFNSDALNFLSKLITSSRPNAEEKRKKHKRKNQKDNLGGEDSSACLQIIGKNLSLLFGDPNAMESYKSLFTILRRLVESQKIQKQQISGHFNSWLLQINFIPCSNFQTWKNKVISLSKMWKNATDLLPQRKMELPVLQKHFSLFTDLLNKLYQDFRAEHQFLQVQQRILLSLCLLYKQLDFPAQMQTDNDMTEFIVKRFQQRNMSRVVLENKFYYCHQCRKNACYACSSFLHRNHDKIYMGKNGNCEHENPKIKRQMKGESGALFGVSAILKKNEDLPEQLLQRISQKLLLEQQMRANQEGDFYGRIRDPQGIRELLQSRGPRGRLDQQSIKQLLQSRVPRNRAERTEETNRKTQETNRKTDETNRRSEETNMRTDETNRRSEEMNRRTRQQQTFSRGNQPANQQKPQDQHDQKLITPEAQEYFQYKQSYSKQFKKIKAQFNPLIPKITIASPKINVSPLAKVFLRELQHQSFIHQEKQNLQNLNSKNHGFAVNQIKEKYLFFKNSNIKSDNKDYPYGRGRGGYGGFGYAQNTHPSQQVKRNVLSCNKKFLFYPSSLSMLSLSMANIKTKLQKKMQEKQYSTLQQQKKFVCTPPANLPFDVLETALSKSQNYPILAAVGHNQISFYPINADGRYARQINPQFHRMDSILKFSWINQTKNLFAIAYSNYVRIGGVSPSNSIKTFAKAQIGKNIRDFDGYMNSKLYLLFIVDSEGLLYFIQVDFKDSRNTSFNAAQRLISLLDEKGQKTNEEVYSVKNIDGNRLLLSCTNGTLKIAQVSRATNSWTTTSIDLRQTMSLESPIVLQSIKLVRNDDQSILISALGRRINASQSLKQRKACGNLLLIKINQDQDQSQILFTKDQNIDSYDSAFLSPSSLIFVYSNQEGAVSFFKHNVQLQPQQIVEKIHFHLTSNSIRDFNSKFLADKLFDRIEEGGMLKNLEFKENKALTGSFVVDLKQKDQIGVKQSQVCSHFVTGLSLTIQLPSIISEYVTQQVSSHNPTIVSVRLSVLSCKYTFACTSKNRQIQVPLNMKETLQLFAHQNQLKVGFSYQINWQVVDKQKYSSKELEEFVKVKGVNVYGFDAREGCQDQGALYYNAYKELVWDWLTYQDYHKQNLEEYLLNFYRLDFHNLEMKKLYKLRYDNANSGYGFKTTEINLFLKLELFSQTVSQSLAADTPKDIQHYLDCIKSHLLSKQYKRKSLENSVLRLTQVVSAVYENKTQISVGHPYHRSSLINYHEFSVSYDKWCQKKSFLTFQKLCSQLSSLVFVQAVDLYLILQVYPELIVQISTYFNQLISENKHKQFQDLNAQNSMAKICSKYVSIVCEYYQVLKNKSVERAEQKMLHLLEQVFGRTKNDMSKQTVMNPFLYLQSIFNPSDSTQIECRVDLFGVGNTSDLSENMFDLGRTVKEQPKEPVLTQMKQQQRGMMALSNWQPIEEQKQLDEQEKQMYMEIQQQFEEEQLELMIEEADLQTNKQQCNPVNLSSPHLPPMHKNIAETLTKTIMAKLLPHNTKINVNHYDFSIQLAIALFRKQDYIDSNNVYFYLGLFYNLLKIIQQNLKLKDNKQKMYQLIRTIDQKIQTPQYSSLFIVLAFFVCPRYGRKNGQVFLERSQSGISQYFTSYYQQNIGRFGQLLQKYNPKLISPTAKFSEIMRFAQFELNNELYNLKLLSNIYLCYRLSGHNFAEQHKIKRIKEELLFKVVKYKLPVLKNIMLFEEWQEQLDRAKILVGFEILLKQETDQGQKEQGINMLHECAKSAPERFIHELLNDQQKVNFLEQFSLLHTQSLNESIQKKVFQLLQIYYSS